MVQVDHPLLLELFFTNHKLHKKSTNSEI